MAMIVFLFSGCLGIVKKTPGTSVTQPKYTAFPAVAFFTAAGFFPPVNSGNLILTSLLTVLIFCEPLNLHR